MSINPRPYQTEAVDAVLAAHARGVQRPAIVMATGLGKTVVFAVLAKLHHERTGERVLVLVHREELASQALAKLRAVAPELRIGLVKANANQTLADIVVCSTPTLRQLNRRRQLLNVGLVIADECHHYAAPSYEAVLRHFCELGAVALGVTATMSRGDKRSLGKVWQEVVFTRDIAFGQQHGFLVPARGKRVRVDDLDMRAVRRKGRGDYDPDALGDALTASMAPKRIAEALTEHSPYGRTVVFAPNIDSAEVISDELQHHGFSSATVNYKTDSRVRERILQQHESGELQIVTNAMVLTEGWDNPACDTAVIARQTTQEALYQQMVGRILRPHFGKTGALVLDVVGASERHTLKAQIDLFGEEYGEPDGTDPCVCSSGLGLCSCRRGGCRPDCACGGAVVVGRRRVAGCGCVWPDQLELDVRVDPVYADGRLIAEDVDLFHGSASQWLTTNGGTHFLAAGERFVAILPGPVAGRWDVVAMHRSLPHDPRWSRYVQRDIPDLGFAQAWAEGDVTPAERLTARKDRTWRVREPSPQQTRYAARYRIDVNGRHAGEVSNLIAIAEASYRIDTVASALRARWEHQ